MRSPEPWFNTIPPRAVWARVGWVIFSGLFLTGGLLCLFQAVIQPVSGWLDSRGWAQTAATVEKSRLTSGRGSKGTTVYEIGVEYSWTWAGRVYRGSRYGLESAKTNIGVERMRREVARLAPGKAVECFVNPANPAEAILVRSLPGSVLLGVFFSLPFLTVGVFGVGFSLFGPGLLGMVRRRRIETLTRMRDDGRLGWPWDARPEDVLEATGFRLIFARSERLALAIAVTALNCFWNGIVGVFLCVAVAEAIGGSRAVAAGLSLFLLPFVGIGACIVWAGYGAWKNALRPDWFMCIHPLPDHQAVVCQLSFAAILASRDCTATFRRMRLVAMAAPWDAASKRPVRSPAGTLGRSRRRANPAKAGKPITKEHELADCEVPLPTPGVVIQLSVPPMPAVQNGGDTRWTRWWDLEIEHQDGRLEAFEISVELP